MKRKIALLLALVMVLSMVPMMAFAASGNTKTIITGVPKLADDYDSEVGKGQFKKAGNIIIEKDSFSVPTGTSFQLRIENAKWSKDPAYQRNVTNGVYAVSDQEASNAANFKIVSRTDKVLDIELLEPIDGEVDNGGKVFDLPLYFKADGTGPIKVTIDPLDSGITGGTYTVANAAKGATVTTVDDVITFSEEGKLDPIRIEETSAGALGSSKTQTIRLRLPSNFEWVSSDVDVEFIGGLSHLNNTSNAKVLTGYDGERDLEIEVNIPNGIDSRGSILVKGTRIFATNNAKEGDVELRISGGEVTSETITVAKYSDFDITVEADGDPTELISGRFEAVNSSGKFEKEKLSELEDETHELQKLIIEEDVEGALLSNRRTRVEFPSWVKILGVKVETTNVEGGDDAVAKTITGLKDANEVIFEEEKLDESYIEFIANPDGDDKAKIELTFFVSVKADAEGDIVAEVSGRSGAEGKVVLGEARRVVEMEIKGKTTMLELGKKGQEIPEIIVSEIEAEDLMDGELILNLSNDAEWGSYKVEVTEGDLELDEDNIDDDAGNLIIPIKKSGISTKPSTIKVSNATIDMKRMAADGDVNVRVRGTSARRNHKAYGDLDNGFFDQNNVVSAKVAELLHGNYREPGLVTQEVVLTIGSKTMFVDGVEETANAAPYIDSANRTMLPVSAIGRALGATVEWNDAARTVLVTKDNTRALLTIGKDVMNVNGMEIPMRSKAVISGERTFVPLKDLGVALGVNVEWDAATRTVTIK